MDKLPIEKEITQSDKSNCMLLLEIPKDLFWFTGHFDSNPILPGVVQLKWALFYAQQIFNRSMEIKSIDLIKFKSPILPNDRVLLKIYLDEVLKKLNFVYYINHIEVSSGRVSLCQ